MKRARVLVADDHCMVAEGLRELLEPEFDVVGVVKDGRAMVDAAKELRPDVIVADISMPMLDGIDALRELNVVGLTSKVVFLTMHPELAYASRALESGARGYLLKHSAVDELITAVREVLSGRTYVTPRIAEGLEQRCRHDEPRKACGADTLTPRQVEVLQLLAEGHSIKRIADMLGISTRTAEFHKYNIMERVDSRGVAGLVKYALKHGIVRA